MTIKPYPILIGFGFRARRGKDTAAQAILEARGGQYDIRRYAFADALREEVEEAAKVTWAKRRPYKPMHEAEPLEVACVLCESLGVPFDPLAVVEPNYPYTKQRSLYQWYGSEFRRSKDAFYWVNRLRERVERENPQIALITDVRFRNEISYIRSMEGYTVRVDRPKLQETLTGAQTQHQSEIELETAPESIWTHGLTSIDGDLEGFKESAVRLFDSIVDSLNPPEISELTQRLFASLNQESGEQKAA